MRPDGYLLETLTVTVPITVFLWWAWIRGKIRRTKSNRWLLSCAAAFLVGPTFMAPYGTWHIYPAWFMAVHLVLGSALGVLLFCVVPLIIAALLIYALTSRFAP